MPTTSRLPYEERILSREHKNKKMAVSVLLIGASLDVFPLLQIKWH